MPRLETCLPKKCLRVPSRTTARKPDTIERDGRCLCVDIYVLPGWNNRSISRSQAQAADAIGLDQRCSAGWLDCRAGPRPSRTSGCLTDSFPPQARLTEPRSASEMVDDIEMQKCSAVCVLDGRKSVQLQLPPWLTTGGPQLRTTYLSVNRHLLIDRSIHPSADQQLPRALIPYGGRLSFDSRTTK